MHLELTSCTSLALALRQAWQLRKTRLGFLALPCGEVYNEYYTEILISLFHQEDFCRFNSACFLFNGTNIEISIK